MPLGSFGHQVISKKNSLHCDLPEATIVLCKTLRCKDCPALFSISQYSVSYNTSPNRSPPYAIGSSASPSQRPLPLYPLCQHPLFLYSPCQFPCSHIPFANFPSLLTIVPISFASCISFPYTHTFDTFSLAIFIPLVLLKICYIYFYLHFHFYANSI